MKIKTVLRKSPLYAVASFGMLLLSSCFPSFNSRKSFPTTTLYFLLNTKQVVAYGKIGEFGLLRYRVIPKTPFKWPAISAVTPFQ